MAKKTKTDYFEDINGLIGLSADMIRDFSKKNADNILFNHSPSPKGDEILAEIEQALKKDYFTPIEREDIFMLAALGNELFHETDKLLCLESEIVITEFSTEIITLSSFLLDGIKNITEIITAFSKFPKTGDLTPNFENHQKICDKFKNGANALISSSVKKNTTYLAVFSVHVITEQLDKCVSCCKKIIDYARYTAIKNS